VWRAVAAATGASIECPWGYGADEPWWSPELAADVEMFFPDEVEVAEMMRARDQKLSPLRALPSEAAKGLILGYQSLSSHPRFDMVKRAVVSDMLRDARVVLGLKSM
jgi:hypothetical protein